MVDQKGGYKINEWGNMNLSDLINFLGESMSAEEFARVINSEVDVYKKTCSKIGASAEVFLHSNTNQKVEIDKEKLCTICRSYLNNTLTEWDISYICDALLLAEQTSFMSEDIRETIEEMTDPAVNGELTRDRAANILETFS